MYNNIIRDSTNRSLTDYLRRIVIVCLIPGYQSSGLNPPVS